MSDDGEMLSVGQYVDRVIGLLEKAENIRLDAQRTAQNAVAAGDLARLRDDPSSVLGSAEELNTLKYQFDAAARPLVQVAYGLDIDAAPLDDFIRTGKPDLVGKAIGVLRRIQGEALKRDVPAIQQHPDAEKIEQIRRGMDAFHDQQRQYEAGLERVSRAVQDVTPISETMKQAYLDAMAEHEQQKVKALPHGDAERNGPFMPADWFRDKFGIPAPRLRAARRDGRLGAIDVGTKRPRYHYSVRDAMRLWPDDDIYLPDASG